MPTDHSHIRRCALAAASSVVLAAGLLGCRHTAAPDTLAQDTASTATDTGPKDTATADTGAVDGHPGDCLGIEDGTEWSACCDTLRAWCEKTYAKDPEQAMTCTFGEDFSGTETGCIPWGPPVPPAATLA